MMIREIHASDKKNWIECLEKVGFYDFYHTPDYMEVCAYPNTQTMLIFIESAYGYVAIPFYIKKINQNFSQTDYFDISSSYGYSGMVLSNNSEELLDDAIAQMRAYCISKNIISVFLRFHPLHQLSFGFLDSHSEISEVGKTISMDLQLSSHKQKVHYRSGIKYNISRAKKKNITCEMVDWETYIDDFIKIYYQTMTRVNATPYYFFPETYFYKLFQSQDFDKELFACFLEGEMIGASIFTYCNGIAQFHLSGTRDQAMMLSPTSLTIDTARVWAIEKGAHSLHLGGGLGGMVDQLFRFKSGFSKTEHYFHVLKMIINPEVYHQLSREKNINPQLSAFFPAYRGSIP
jgi:Acetyltransferase (GNAT) domain